MSAHSTILQALDWAMTAPEAAVPGLLSSEQLRKLRSVVRGESAWDWSLYEPFQIFAHVAYRQSASKLPLEARFSMGDLFELQRTLSLRDEPPTSTRLGSVQTPSTEAFAQLGYRNISSGLSDLQSRNPLGWGQHGTHSKRLIERSTQELPGETAAVIGAGKAYDIPLAALAERYQRLVLVDIDLDSLTETALSTFGTLPEHVELEGIDATGVVSEFVGAVQRLLGTCANEEDALGSLLKLLRSYHSPEPPQIFGEPLSVDVGYSVMVLSQLATPLTRWVERTFAAHFPTSSAVEHPEFQVALKRFAHQLQHDHIRGLMAHCGCFVLSTDVSTQAVTLNSDGQLARLSGELPILGAQRVDELVPLHGCSYSSQPNRQAEVLDAVEWIWARVQPGAGTEGSMSRVQGALVKVVEPGSD